MSGASPPPDGLVLGWPALPPGTGRAGFHATPPAGAAAGEPLLLPPEAHAMVIGRTGCGKGTCSIVPALLTCGDPMIVVDPKGEALAITRRRRLEMGHRVVVIDPTGVSGRDDGDAFNPLDLIDINSAGAVDEIAALVQTLAESQTSHGRDPFWMLRAMNLLVAVVLLVLERSAAAERTLSTVRRFVDGAAANPKLLAERLAACRHPEARQGSAMLQMAADNTVGGIVAVAQSMLDFLRGEQTAAAVARTSFDLDAVRRGEPLTLYLVLPPHLLESHGRLLRLWLSALLTCIVRRRRRPPRDTLLLLDECAAIGELPQLRQAITLLRGYGLRTVSYWQDLSQLVRLYPEDWKAMLNNCQALQFFGVGNHAAARELADTIGWHDAAQLAALAPGRVLLQLAGREPMLARAPDYRRDALFAGQFDENPYHRRGPMEDPAPRRSTALAQARLQHLQRVPEADGLVAAALRCAHERGPRVTRTACTATKAADAVAPRQTAAPSPADRPASAAPPDRPA